MSDLRITEKNEDDPDFDVEILSPLPAARLPVTSAEQDDNLDSSTTLLLREVFSLSAESSHFAGGVRGTMRGFVESSMDERPVCQLCGKAFKNRNTLANHKSVYHRDEIRKLRQ
ncbi:unnamed protein product [Orchesella dallaii]|uniref:C2H2-type domain-containing protein n=1 Tax=Orchesella dallaii TaxID=48710 RepID=A0ABP1QYQ7_9HEXA